MRNITTYITEKLKINKNIKVEEIYEKPLSKDYVFIVAYNQAYNDLSDVYSDSLVSTESGDHDGFIVPRLTGESFIEHNDTTVYRIPNKYKYLEDFEEAYQNGECSIEDLKEI